MSDITLNEIMDGEMYQEMTDPIKTQKKLVILMGTRFGMTEKEVMVLLDCLESAYLNGKLDERYKNVR